MALVSVHIVTYNNSATIERCLQALREQQGVEFETYIIDNASADDTVDQIERMGFEVCRNTKNLGYAVAQNQALAATDSRYILTLNPDVLLFPGYISHLTAALDAGPLYGSAAGCLFRVDHLGEPPTGVDSTGLLMSHNRRQLLRDDACPIGQHTQQSTPIFGPDGSAAFYRRAMLNDIRVDGEVFDDDFFIHKEDVDVCWRAQLRGWKSIYVPAATAHHIRGFRPGQRHGVASELRFFSVRNRYLMMIKNEIPAHFWRNLPAIVAYDLGILAYVLLFERQSLPAFRSAWVLRDRMLKKRQWIQAHRTVDWPDIQPLFNR